MNFVLIHQDELSEKHFMSHNEWAQYYEPDDLETISSWGININSLTEKFGKIGWSDKYCFPVLKRDDIECFQCYYRAANFVDSFSNKYFGYTINEGHAIVLFHNNKSFSFNFHLKELAIKSAEKLKPENQHAKNLFPVNYSYVGSEDHYTFALTEKMS